MIGPRRHARASLLPGVVAALGLLTSLVACGARPQATTAFRPSAPTGAGYKALFRGESRTPQRTAHFRVAVALLAPDRLRLEFLGPAGGPRLIVAAAGARVTALMPSERLFDRSEDGPAAMERLVGVPLDGARMIALLTGSPMCPAETAEQIMRTRGAATFGRTLAWYDVVCPPGEIRYQARAAERGGVIKEATVRDGTSGAMILQVEYGSHEDGRGPRWPHQIRLQLARRQSTVTLQAIDGPEQGDLDESMFTPPIPDGFEARPDLLSLPAPGLLGPSGDGER